MQNFAIVLILAFIAVQKSADARSPFSEGAAYEAILAKLDELAQSGSPQDRILRNKIIQILYEQQIKNEAFLQALNNRT